MLTKDLVFWGLTALAIISFLGAIIFFVLDIRDHKKKKSADGEAFVLEKKEKKQKNKKSKKDKNMELPLVQEVVSPTEEPQETLVEEGDKMSFTQSFDADRIDQLLGKINK